MLTCLSEFGLRNYKNIDCFLLLSVVAYVRDEIPYKQMHLGINNERNTIELALGKENVIVFCLYNSPSTTKLPSKLNSFPTASFILGDVNMDLKGESVAKNQYLEILKRNNFTQLVNNCAREILYTTIIADHIVAKNI